MNTFFLVVSNLKHGGDLYVKGTVLEAPLTAFESLVKDGVLRVIKGAESLAHATELVAAELETKIAPTAEKVAEPQNTWGPQPDQPVVADQNQVVDTTVKTEATTVKFNVLKEFTVTDETSKNFGTHKVGEVVEADPVAAQVLVDNGTLQLADASPTETGANL